ncbi:hypothetical protein JOD97_000535 [Duganella sp. 1411]|uniref:hypothetical protein n=1 Tax=Duganella sp. 1411 TaxID=2806572 RepID=UPI001AE55340|nr:hypothetical protein [Duganella sp. 1411]MBP1202521.1 hypothetical protein [Duganella sp. 1411]
MSTYLHCGAFGRDLAAAIAAHRPEPAATMLDAAQFSSGGGTLDGPVFALFSSLRLDLMRDIAQALTPSASLFSGFAFERHVILAPPCSPAGVCARCFGKRLLSQPPAPYSAETLFFLAKLAAVPALEFRGYHPGLVELAAQLCLLQAGGQLAADASLLIDTGTAQVHTSKIMPFHGCICRSPTRATCAGPQRFAAFDKELGTWIA